MSHLLVPGVAGFFFSLAANLCFGAGFGGDFTDVGHKHVPGTNTTESVDVLLELCRDGKKFNMGECDMGYAFVSSIIACVAAFLVALILVVISVLKNKPTDLEEKKKLGTGGYA